MQNAHRFRFSALLVLLTLWLGWTSLVDFVVVPAVFRNVHDFFEAGDLGVLLFTKLNSIEVVIASVVFAVLVLNFRTNRHSFPLLLGSFLALAIAFAYFLWLIPKLAHLTELWKLAEAGKTVGLADVQQEHQYFHRLYVTLDTVKIFILTLLLGLTIGKTEWTA